MDFDSAQVDEAIEFRVFPIVFQNPDGLRHYKEQNDFMKKVKAATQLLPADTTFIKRVRWILNNGKPDEGFERALVRFGSVAEELRSVYQGAFTAGQLAGARDFAIM